MRKIIIDCDPGIDDALAIMLAVNSPELEIVAKAPIAQKAIPACNITCIDGNEMKDALGGYLSALHELEPTSIGGALPADDFYYGAK